MLGLVDEKGSWKNATIMAKASFYAYSNKSAFDKEFSTECVLWDKEGTQAFGWQDGRNVCVVFRGTEALQWSDIKADLKVRKGFDSPTTLNINAGYTKSDNSPNQIILVSFRYFNCMKGPRA